MIGLKLIKYIKVMENKNSSVENIRFVNTGGVSALGILGGVLVVLKCMGYISVSWLWVLAPFWIPFALVSLILIGIVIAAFCMVDTNTKINQEEDFVSTATNEANCNEDIKKVVLDNTVKDAQPKKKRSRKKLKKDNSNEQNNATTEGDTNK